MLYQYWLVRYVPDTARPDTVSAGVVVAGDSSAESAVRFVPTPSALPHIGHNRELFFQSLTQLSSEVSLYIEDGEIPLEGTRDLRVFMERQRRQNYGLVQFDPPGQIVANSVSEAVEILYDRLVFRENLETKQHRLSKLRMMAKDKYESFSTLGAHTMYRPILEIGRSEEKLDLAVISDEVVELSSAFSFMVQPSKALRDKVLAWTYSMDKIRRGGGRLGLSKKEKLGVPAQVPILALVEQPETNSQKELYKDATVDWNSLGIHVLNPSEVDAHAAVLDHQLSLAV